MILLARNGDLQRAYDPETKRSHVIGVYRDSHVRAYWKNRAYKGSAALTDEMKSIRGAA